jgi:hypothetical protein
MDVTCQLAPVVGGGHLHQGLARSLAGLAATPKLSIFFCSKMSAFSGPPRGGIYSSNK